jgi:hypothetical protein
MDRLATGHMKQRGSETDIDTVKMEDGSPVPNFDSKSFEYSLEGSDESCHNQNV